MELAELRTITSERRWADVATHLLKQPRFGADASWFGTYWIESGHHIREQLGNDQKLVQLLRLLLTPYEGESMELFRGENKDRWSNGQIGLAWTSSMETARMFGRGLNAVHSGGVLLRAQFDAAAIISAPNSHSTYLGEAQFTVDPFLLVNTVATEFFPPIQ